LTATTEREAQDVHDIGWMMDDDKGLAVVPYDCNVKDEDERTVLLVGVNKVHEYLKNKGKRMIELFLLKTVKNAG
jgi:hypothetical protein